MSVHWLLEGHDLQGLSWVTFMVLMFLSARLILTDYILVPLAHYMGRKDPLMERKISESGCKIAYWLPMVIWGYYLAWTLPWTSKTTNLWDQWPNTPIEPNLRSYYLTQLAYYCYSLFAHIKLDIRRSDHTQMFVHHIVTIALIYFSYYFKFHRIGLMVLVCLDPCDLLLESAKICNYVGLQYLANPLFVLFMLSWLVLRLGMFPYICLYSAFFEAQEVVKAQRGYYAPTAYSVFFNGLLWTLQALQIFWFQLIVRAAVKMLRTGEANDEERESIEAEGNAKEKKN